MRLPEKLFVTGTDTGIGKTVVSAMLTLGMGARYWKPIQSGLEEETDTQFVRRVTGLADSCFAEERFRLTAPLSPHASARLDGVTMQLHDFTLPSPSPNGRLVVEGAGGLLVPINPTRMIVDLIEYLALPVVLVVRTGLGTINHTLLSIEALRRRSIPVAGVVMNGAENSSNREAIEHYGKTPVLGVVQTMDVLNRENLKYAFEHTFNQD